MESNNDKPVLTHQHRRNITKTLLAQIRKVLIQMHDLEDPYSSQYGKLKLLMIGLTRAYELAMDYNSRSFDDPVYNDIWEDQEFRDRMK